MMRDARAVTQQLTEVVAQQDVEFMQLKTQCGDNATSVVELRDLLSNHAQALESSKRGAAEALQLHATHLQTADEALRALINDSIARVAADLQQLAQRHDDVMFELNGPPLPHPRPQSTPLYAAHIRDLLCECILRV